MVNQTTKALECQPNGQRAKIQIDPAPWNNYRIILEIADGYGYDEDITFRSSTSSDSAFKISFKDLEKNDVGHKWKDIIFEKIYNGVVTSSHHLAHTQVPTNSPAYRVTLEMQDDHIQMWIGGPRYLEFYDRMPALKDGVITVGCTPSTTFTPAPSEITRPGFYTIQATRMFSRGKYPVIFIPGIMGSELKMSDNISWIQDNGHGGTHSNLYFKDELIWLNSLEAALPGSDDYFDVLRMLPDGSSEAPLELTGKALSDYDQTLEFFQDQGYELGRTLFVFPYDWRKNVAQTYEDLDNLIDNAVNGLGL